MKKIDLGQTIGILANIGVFVGVLLLVFELAQNRQMMRSQIRNDLNTGLMNYQMISSDEQIAEIMERVQNDGGLANLNEVEKRRFDVIRGMQARYFENMHYQYRAGLFDDEEFLAQREFWRRVYSQKANIDYWCSVRDTYSPEFKAEINGLIGQPCE